MVTNRLNVLPTANPEWGFWGAIRQRVEPTKAWALVMRAIAKATGSPDTAIHDFVRRELMVRD